MDAIFKHGEPTMIDYTSGTAVPAGSVIPGIVAGLNSVVTHRDLEANVMGAVACGGGIYEMTSLEGAANFSKVWFDATTKKVTTVSSTNTVFGYIVGGGGGAANSKALVLHRPEG